MNVFLLLLVFLFVLVAVPVAALFLAKWRRVVGFGLMGFVIIGGVFISGGALRAFADGVALALVVGVSIVTFAIAAWRRMGTVFRALFGREDSPDAAHLLSHAVTLIRVSVLVVGMLGLAGSILAFLTSLAARPTLIRILTSAIVAAFWAILLSQFLLPAVRRSNERLSDEDSLIDTLLDFSILVFGLLATVSFFPLFESLTANG